MALREYVPVVKFLLKSKRQCATIRLAKAKLTTIQFIPTAKKRPPGRGWSSPEGRFLRWRAYCSLLCLSSHLLTQLETMFAATDTMKLTIQSMDPPPPAAGVGGDSRFIIAKCDKIYKL